MESNTPDTLWQLPLRNKKFILPWEETMPGKGMEICSHQIYPDKCFKRFQS